MSDEKVDWKAVLAKAKVIGIIVCCCIVVCGACFFGGYRYSEYKLDKAGTESVAKLRTELDSTKSSLASAETELSAAKQHVTELESTINSALGSAEQNNKLIEDAQVTSGDIGDSVEGLTKLFTEYTELVEQLQENNIKLTNRLKSSVREDAGQ